MSEELNKIFEQMDATLDDLSEGAPVKDMSQNEMCDMLNSLLD